MEDDVWNYIVWNPISKKMISSVNTLLIERMLKYFTKAPLPESEKIKMVDEFRSMKGDATLTEDEILQKFNSYIVV